VTLSSDFWSALAGRAVQAVLVAVVVGIVSFSMMQALPGDSAYRIAAGRYGYDMMDAASADTVRAELGLDQPTSVQLLTWLGSLAKFDLGKSAVTGMPISEEIGDLLGYTLGCCISADCPTGRYRCRLKARGLSRSNQPRRFHLFSRHSRFCAGCDADAGARRTRQAAASRRL